VAKLPSRHTTPAPTADQAPHRAMSIGIEGSASRGQEPAIHGKITRAPLKPRNCVSIGAMGTGRLARTRAENGGQCRQEARQRRGPAMVGRSDGKHFVRDFQGGYWAGLMARRRRDFHHQIEGVARAVLRHMRSLLLNSPFANRLFICASRSRVRCPLWRLNDVSGLRQSRSCL
jgi:hypothetical protein